MDEIAKSVRWLAEAGWEAWASLAAAGAMLLLLPDTLGVRGFVDTYRPAVVIPTLFFSALAAFDLVAAGMAKADAGRGRVRKLYEGRLTYDEKSLLWQFVREDKRVLELPIDHPAVQGLLMSGLIFPTDGRCRVNLGGVGLTSLFQIADPAWDFIREVAASAKS